MTRILWILHSRTIVGVCVARVSSAYPAKTLYQWIRDMYLRDDVRTMRCCGAVDQTYRRKLRGRT
jgi:hypothetical protein